MRLILGQPDGGRHGVPEIATRRHGSGDSADSVRGMDGFRLAYDDHPGDGVPVVLLHGWPGDRQDYRAVVPLLAGRRVLVPDLRGFGDTTNPADVDAAADATAYGVDGQAAEVIALVEATVGGPVVLGGYDVGSRTAQAVAKARPDLVRGVVISPPVPGVGHRILGPDPQREFWYQAFHRLPLSERLLDGNRAAVRAYLEHFWTHWSGPDYTPEPAQLARLADAYARPGAFVRSINWYRSGSAAVARALAEQTPDPADRITPPTTILWPEHDPLFSRDWSDKVDDWFAAADLRFVDGIGHFVPLEAPEVFAAALREH
jgi:pimeloyl-ACP methyl ester carboxylesterase